MSHDICSHPPHGAVLRDGSVPSTSRIFAAPPHLGSSEHESDKRKRMVVGAAERSGMFIGQRHDDKAAARTPLEAGDCPSRGMREEAGDAGYPPQKREGRAGHLIAAPLSSMAKHSLSDVPRAAVPGLAAGTLVEPHSSLAAAKRHTPNPNSILQSAGLLTRCVSPQSDVKPTFSTTSRNLHARRRLPPHFLPSTSVHARSSDQPSPTLEPTNLTPPSSYSPLNNAA